MGGEIRSFTSRLFFDTLSVLLHNLFVQKGLVYFAPIAGTNGQLETVHDWASFWATVVGQPGVGLPFFDCMIFQNNIIKGRIAEDIVSEMLREAGYLVYRFGYEGILQSLIQKGLPVMRKDSITAEKIRTMPDFIVMDKNCDVFFVEVKYRNSEKKGDSFNDWLRKATKYWPEAKLILAHPYQPYFQISTISDYAKSGRLYPLERDKFLKVPYKIITDYAGILRKYFQ